MERASIIVEEKLIMEKVEGKVKWFDAVKGIGFTTYNGEDVFIHFKDINMDGFRVVKSKQDIVYDLVETSKGLQARNVKRK